MNPASPNPYQPPEAGESFSEGPKPLHPPVTGKRLAIGLALITGGWLALWAERQGLVLMNLIALLCFISAMRLTDHQPAKQEISPRDLPVLLIWLLVGVIGMYWFVKSKPHLLLEAVSNHPATYVMGWAIFCGLLLTRWWKRRNNPPPGSKSEDGKVARPSAWGRNPNL
jgi:hypothetical protein